jgi:hypothetical protein
MGRRRKDDEIERLEQEVRDLKAVNRSLLKRLKKLNRGYRKERGEEKNKGKKPPRQHDTREEETDLPPRRKCPDCETGEVLEVIVLDRRWEECTLCFRRTKAKIV